MRHVKLQSGNDVNAAALNRLIIDAAYADIKARGKRLNHMALRSGIDRRRENFTMGDYLFYVADGADQPDLHRPVAHAALTFVVLHVVPPALFALAHAAALYRAKGIAAMRVPLPGDPERWPRA